MRKDFGRKVLTSQNEVYLKQKLESALSRGWVQIGEVSYKNGLFGVCVQFDIAKNLREIQLKTEEKV